MAEATVEHRVGELIRDDGVDVLNPWTVKLSPEASDFLVDRLAVEAFYALQADVEFKEPFDVERMRRAQQALARSCQKVELLQESDEVRLTRPLITNAGKWLGEWSVYELDGWREDEEYEAKRRGSRRLWEELIAAGEEAARRDLEKGE